MPVPAARTSLPRTDRVEAVVEMVRAATATPVGVVDGLGTALVVDVMGGGFGYSSWSNVDLE